MRTLTSFSLFIILSLTACQENKNQESNDKKSSNTSNIPSETTDSISSIDSTLIVRENFNRINAIKDWDSIDSANIHESTEGRIAKYYIKNNVLELIKVRNYGEGGYTLEDFYLKDGKMSFAFEQIYRYNTHFIDPKFDISKTQKFAEVRYYYFDDSLFNITSSDKETEMYYREDKQVEKEQRTMFDKLLKIKANGYDATGISE